MNEMQPPVVDCHVHVGLIGDRWPNLGGMSDRYRRMAVYKAFLLFAGVDPDDANDEHLKQITLEKIEKSTVNKLVCLALDPVYDSYGKRQEGLSHVWVDNDYVISLKEALPNRILLGASVHPYDPNFRIRLENLVVRGAVLLKWLPSAQQIDLESERVAEALDFLASVKRDGKPVPLLLHTGPEYAIPSTDDSTASYDFLTWSGIDDFTNLFRFKHRWRRRHPRKIHANLERFVRQGGHIIFAHCGLPYFVPGILSRYFEHTEFEAVKGFLERSATGDLGPGRCFADTSACVTPFRQSYFGALKRLPAETLLYGSDFPTPAFELSADLEEVMKDLKAVVKGDLKRIIVPQDNMLDVSLREMHNAFGDHSMFTNFGRTYL